MSQDVVTFRNRFTQAPSVIEEGKAIKAPDAATPEKMKAGCMQGFLEDSDEFDSLARNMVSSGAGVTDEGFEGCFQDANMHSIKMMTGDDGAESESTVEGDEVESADDNDDGGKSGKPAKSVKDDGDKKTGTKRKAEVQMGETQLTSVRSKCQRLWRISINTLQDAFTQTRDSASELLREAYPNREVAHLKNSFNLCGVRPTFAAAVLLDNSGTLDKLIG